MNYFVDRDGIVNVLCGYYRLGELAKNHVGVFVLIFIYSKHLNKTAG
jgi:hypothetical protein